MISMYQEFVAASPTVTPLVTVPPGPCTVVLSAIGSGAAVSVGISSTGTTSTNGMIVNAGQSITLHIPPDSAGFNLYGVGIGGTAIMGSVITS
jgi:hypothetical protein